MTLPLIVKKVIAFIIILIGAVLFYINHIYGFIDQNSPQASSENLKFHLSLLQFLGTVIVSVVAVLGLWFTNHSINENKKSAKKKLTIDLVFATDQNKELQDAKNLIFILASNDKLVPHYLHLKSPVKLEDAKHIRSRISDTYKVSELTKIEREKDKKLDELFSVFNHYENIAAGIRIEAFDERLFKELHYSNFIKLWENIQPLVIVIRRRQNRDTLFQEMEWLYHRWKDDPITTINRVMKKPPDC